MKLTPRRFASLAFATITMLSVSAGHAQATRILLTESDLAKDPSGIPLLHLARGTQVSITGAPKAGWIQATINGWIAEGALHEDKRDGFDLSVSTLAGTTVRSAPNGGGNVLATARLGALFDKVEAKGGWVHVRRTGWLAQIAFTAPPAAAKPPPTKPVTAPAGAVAAGKAAVAATPTAATTVAAGSSLSAQAAGPTIGSLEAPAKAEMVEHRGGWAHVRLDVWVRDAAVGTAPEPGGITAADLRATPDKFVGQTVEWTVEVLGVEKADELRPELPIGQPYVLARGPLPENGFLYIAVSKDEADTFRAMQPLAKVRIRATIRAGRSRFLPTPVLNFVRLLN